jgi:hypothetical protein
MYLGSAQHASLRWSVRSTTGFDAVRLQHRCGAPADALSQLWRAIAAVSSARLR